MRFAVRASSLLPWALCLGGLGALGCQSQLLTLGTRPVENEGGSGGAGFGGIAAGTSGSAGAGGIPGGQGGSDSGGVSGSDAGEGGSNAGAAGGSAGDSGAGTIRIIDISPIAELSSEDEDDNPTLTADLVHIFFLSTRGESADVWTASRSSPTGVFGPAELVDAVNTEEAEASPAISLDGLTLWVGQEREGGLGGNDIWAVTRSSSSSAWSEPANVTALNSTADDIPRQPGFQSLTMPLGSRRDLDGQFHTYFASRTSVNAAFGAPQLLSELVFDDRNTVDGFLSAASQYIGLVICRSIPIGDQRAIVVDGVVVHHVRAVIDESLPMTPPRRYFGGVIDAIFIQVFTDMAGEITRFL